MTRLQAAAQLRRAIQMFVSTLNEEEALEVATVLPEYQTGKAYAVGERITYGVNGVGDPQVYKVAQAHTSAAEWAPDKTPALYTPVGIAQSGYDKWSQPAGAHDAYNIGDVVDYDGRIYESTINGNVWSPTAYPAGWKVV